MYASSLLASLPEVEPRISKGKRGGKVGSGNKTKKNPEKNILRKMRVTQGVGNSCTGNSRRGEVEINKQREEEEEIYTRASFPLLQSA